MESEDPGGTGTAENDSMPSSSGNLDDSNPSVSEKDKKKYEYLSEYFVLESVKTGAGKTRTLYFKCHFLITADK